MRPVHKFIRDHFKSFLSRKDAMTTRIVIPQHRFETGEADLKYLKNKYRVREVKDIFHNIESYEVGIR